MVLVRFGKTSIKVRGIHCSPLRGGPDVIQSDDKLIWSMETNNKFDPNAIRLTNAKEVFLGHVAIEQSKHVKAILQQSGVLGIDVGATFYKFESETVTKSTGSTYEGICADVYLHFSATSEIENCDKLRNALSKLVKSNKLMLELPDEPHKENESTESTAIIDGRANEVKRTARRPLGSTSNFLFARGKRTTLGGSRRKKPRFTLGPN